MAFNHKRADFLASKFWIFFLFNRNESLSYTLFINMDPLGNTLTILILKGFIEIRKVDHFS